MNIKHTIFSNDTSDYDLDEVRKDIAACNNCSEEDISDERVYDSIHNEIDDTYTCERELLDTTLQGRILCIADLGRWDGRHKGYRIMGCNLNEVLSASSSDDTYTVGSNGHNIVGIGIHHDGTNYYTFREIREDKNIDTLLAKIYNETATAADISRYTKSLVPYANRIYGWSGPKAFCGKEGAANAA